MDMRVPLQVPAKGMQAANDAGKKVFLLVEGSKPGYHGRSSSLKKQV